MPLTRPLPAKAAEIVEILRRDVPRPASPPVEHRRALRWLVPGRRTGVVGGHCPMGLHPRAETSCPGNPIGFPLSSATAICEFGAWWDAQSDPQAAVDAVWPPDGGCIVSNTTPLESLQAAGVPQRTIEHYMDWLENSNRRLGFWVDGTIPLVIFGAGLFAFVALLLLVYFFPEGWSH